MGWVQGNLFKAFDRVRLGQGERHDRDQGGSAYLEDGDPASKLDIRVHGKSVTGGKVENNALLRQRPIITILGAFSRSDTARPVTSACFGVLGRVLGRVLECFTGFFCLTPVTS